jgi:hypothetical protein
VSGVGVATGHAELEPVVVVVLAVEPLVDEVAGEAGFAFAIVVEVVDEAVAGSFGLEIEADEGVGFALAAVAEGAEPAAPAAHSEWVEWQVEHFESDLDSVDIHAESAFQDDRTEVAVVVFDSAAVEHEEDNRPASAAGEAQADVQAK